MKKVCSKAVLAVMVFILAGCAPLMDQSSNVGDQKDIDMGFTISDNSGTITISTSGTEEKTAQTRDISSTPSDMVDMPAVKTDVKAEVAN